jgi:hypothetical protein
MLKVNFDHSKGSIHEAFGVSDERREELVNLPEETEEKVNNARKKTERIELFLTNCETIEEIAFMCYMHGTFDGQRSINPLVEALSKAMK